MRTKIRRTSEGTGRVVLVACAMLLQIVAAPAQETPKSLPHLALTEAQKQTIFISVTNQNFKNEAPPNFQPVVGAVVPENVDLEEMPKTIVQLAPETKAFRLARVAHQVVIVDPQTRRVVEVIAKNP